ncbi:MAG: parallel beta-helix repeat, partial [Pedosphaera sp.]|nr:parallel beta-helix repeat [Pedosphaera sp.]
VGGGTILGPQYNPIRIPTEASGRMCVQLNSTGQYIQFTNQSAATALVVRYCVPDTADGVGADYTLSLYTNGVLAGRLPVTSKYSWLYGNYPFTNNPTAGFAHNFFDEARTNGLILSAGTVVRLQKDATDTAANYIIDLVDAENVPAALSQPANSISVTNYGAVGDHAIDCTAAFQNSINAANSQNKPVWIPPGDYLITGTINLYSNTRMNGAGMWYSKLVGSPALYTTPSRRVNLNSAGSNIKLSDFAIIGRLNYRNDSEGNDGLGGSYGTGSSIARIWVEHTKSAAWIFNSSGLVVDSCRFRDTIADGINVNYAMQNTVVTNCTARGTGDDCFAIWPAPASGNYVPGNNVITHCTGQLPHLANGGAIYGGANNRIEDSLFSDLPYGAGILFSTTFKVSFTFSGTNVAQRCDVIRCGGYDGGYGWRSALQIVIDSYGSNGIPGLNLNNLNIIDSISSGLSILGGVGLLTNATATSVNIPDYNLNNISGQHAWWAKCLNGCPSGALAVSNSVVPEYQNDSGTFNFYFVSNVVRVSVQPNVQGAAFLVDGASYTNTNTFSWPPGSNHSLAAVGSQSAGPGTQYVWSSWSDSGAISHFVSPALSTNFTVNFTTQYSLTLNTGPGGSVSPVSMWTNSGLSLSISATPSNGIAFGGWIGTGNGCYSGENNTAMITLNGPIIEQAVFLPPAPSITGLSVNGTNSAFLTYETQPGFHYHVETATNLAPPFWAALSGSTTNALGTSATFTDTNLYAGALRFYRTVSP